MKKILVVGSLNMDYVLQTERLPMKGETLPAKDFLMVHGGKGMNQSVAIKRLGSNPILIGCLGKDKDGDTLVQGLKDESIQTAWIARTEEMKTGIAFITVSDNGENTIVVHPGSNHALNGKWVLEAIREHSDAHLLVLQMEIPYDVIISTIDEAFNRNIPVILNPSPFKAIPKTSFQKVHTLIVNEVEAKQIAESIDEKSILSDGRKNHPEALIEFLVKQKIPRVILTMGDQGVYYNHDQNSEEDPLILHRSAKKVKVVDSTAAGDSFLGAYVAGQSIGYTLDQSVSYGIHAGALAVTKSGAQPSIPSKKDLIDFGWRD